MAVPRRILRLAPLTTLVVLVILVLYLTSSDSPARSLARSRFPLASHSRPSSARIRKKAKISSVIDWTTVRQFHPPASIKPLPTGAPKAFPPVQAPSSAFHASPEADRRRTAVRHVFKRSYDAYKKHAWLSDELMPVSGGRKDPFGGWAATLVDSLDTLWIMGFKDEFAEATDAVCAIDWANTQAGAANLFETTIRHLGGLLAAHDLSGDADLLDKAHELGEMLYHAFDTPNRLPGFWLNFQEARDGQQVAGINDASAAPASLSLEFTRLSQLTGDAKFYDAIDRVTRFLERIQNDTLLPGMWPIQLDFRNELARDSRFTLGALADSLYEYLPKMHILLGGLDDTYERLYRLAIEAVVEKLLFRPMLPDQKDVLFTGDWHANMDHPFIPESQHLTCFVGGMFALGGRVFSLDEHVSIGERLARGCAWAYGSFPTGVMPEIFNLIPCAATREPCEWDEEHWLAHGNKNLAKGFSNARDARYQLRPEAIESLFILYRVTGKTELQDIAWTMFESIVRSTETPLAYSSISDVTEKGNTTKLNSMEASHVPLRVPRRHRRLTQSPQSFWMAETLKYFYLIFSPPDVISLDEYVLNTEAHPLRRPTGAAK
ncbi:glycosyl hydrolase [Drechmeria coniospora]|uniref:alpha-1,2-Mannosidase n=1 Tax=Drechmeria coniospora TaxID=98403 RepID=A0A151GIQ6_DRECN|nr:glycosyl hydrolase [Drechmeria coniospora]KYK56968.1 glycosyl hydrolase [Drechmeria coniospora]